MSRVTPIVDFVNEDIDLNNATPSHVM